MDATTKSTTPSAEVESSPIGTSARGCRGLLGLAGVMWLAWIGFLVFVVVTRA